MRDSPEMQVVGFLDDDERLHNRLLYGLKIYNPVDIRNIKKYPKCKIYTSYNAENESHDKK